MEEFFRILFSETTKPFGRTFGWNVVLLVLYKIGFYVSIKNS
jgi:hypothetical protein